MGGPLIGAHAVPDTRLYAVAWVSGLLASVWATITGIWTLAYGRELFYKREVWETMAEVIGSHYGVVGWIILIGGILGILGLATRSRALSLISCGVCILWCGWFVAFLWYANFTGPLNLAGNFAILAGLVFILRFWLLLAVPELGEPGGRGW